MKKCVNPFALTVASSLVLMLTGCGGSSDTKVTLPPTAVALISQDKVNINESVNLDGTQSISPNAGVSQWTWMVDSAPADSTAKPAENAQSTTFSADKIGDYTLCLTVQDDQKSSAPSCQQLTAVNPNPTAVSLAEMGSSVGDQVQLDASNSLPPTEGDASALSYQWKLIKKPEDSTAELDDTGYVKPRLTTDIEGNYELELVVSYLDKVSPAIIVMVRASALNAIPNPEFTITGGDADGWVLGDTVTLDASATVDADGDELEYRWFLGAAERPFVPDGSSATLDKHTGKVVTFTPDKFGQFSVELAVYDGTIRKTVNKRIEVNQLASDHVNKKPVAKVGANFTTGTYEVELADTLQLWAFDSVDIETGNPYYMMYEWELLSYPDGFDPATADLANPFAPSLSMPVAGDYTLQLRANDGVEWSEPVTGTFTALVGANRKPTASAKLAGAGNAALIGQTITFDGGESKDPDDNELTYHWTLIDKPNGSTAELKDANKVTPSLVADKAGAYVVEMHVTDNHGASSVGGFAGPQRVLAMAKAENNLPIIRPQLEREFSDEQPLVVYPVTDLVFDADTGNFDRRSLNSSVVVSSDAFDPDGDPLSYLWHLKESPESSELVLPASIAGSGYGHSLCMNGRRVTSDGEYKTNKELFEGVLAMREWTCQDIVFAPSMAGDYVVSLQVSDGIETTEAVEFAIPAVAPGDYPTLLLEDLHDSVVLVLDGLRRQAGTSHRQKLFPYNVAEKSNFPIFNSYLNADGETLAKRFTLTAFDQDYTIKYLKTVSQDDFAVSFKGLEDGQVIQQGESVTFDLIITSPADVTVNQFDSTNAAEELHWSFEIAERPNWTFDYSPYIYASRASE